MKAVHIWKRPRKRKVKKILYTFQWNFEKKTVGKEDGKLKLSIVHKFSPYVSTFSFHFLRIFQWQNWNCFHHWSTDACKNPAEGQDHFCSNESLLRKSVNQLHDFCVSLSAPAVAMPSKHLIWHLVCVCVRVSGWISQPYIVLCPVSAICASQSTNRNATTRPVPLNDTPRFMQKQRVRRWDGAYLLVLHQGLKQLHSKRAANWNRKKWKAWSKKVALQDPASTAAKSHSNLTFSIWTWVQYTWSKKALTGLYIEESTLKHRVPAQPLHPACPCAVLQREGFWQHKGLGKAQYDFGGKFHPHLQRLGNTEKGSPPVGGRCRSVGLLWTIPFPF